MNNVIITAEEAQKITNSKQDDNDVKSIIIICKTIIDEAKQGFYKSRYRYAVTPGVIERLKELGYTVTKCGPFPNYEVDLQNIEVSWETVTIKKEK